MQHKVKGHKSISVFFCNCYAFKLFFRHGLTTFWYLHFSRLHNISEKLYFIYKRD